MKQSELIGYKLKKHRMSLNLSQGQLAEKLNVRQNTISGYEKDGIHDIDLIMDINNKLGINLLLNNKEDMLFNRTILNKIYTYYTSERDCQLLSIEELQDILLYGYGNKTDLLNYALLSMENEGLIKRYKNELDNSDNNTYVVMTAKGVLSLDPDNNKFPGDLTLEHLSETKIQELINQKIENSNIKYLEETKKKNLKMVDFIKRFNEKQESAKKCIERNKVKILSIDCFDKLIKESFIKEKSGNIQCYFDFVRKQLPYKKWIQLFYNLLLEAYKKIYFNCDDYDHFQYKTCTSALYKYTAPLDSLADNDIDTFVSQLLFNDTQYEYISESLLIKAIISYLLENETISEEDKNLENVRRLLYSMSINENSPYSEPPLERLFKKIELLNPEFKCIELYKQFKLLNLKDQ